MAGTRQGRILITGAASGIGLGLAQCLGSAGHALLLSDRDQAGLEEASARLSGVGVQARLVVMDVASLDAIAAATPAIESFGVDVLINNAGLQHVSPLEQFPPETWARLVAVMLVGPAMLSRAVLPGMRARGYGRIINLGSIHSLVASAYKSAYVAAKHGLAGLTKTLALETSDAEITVNTICPSYVLTPLVAAQISAQAAAHGMPEERVINDVMLRPMPKRKFVEIGEIAALVEYLISDAARNVTGQSIAIDGGWTAQ